MHVLYFIYGTILAGIFYLFLVLKVCSSIICHNFSPNFQQQEHHQMWFDSGAKNTRPIFPAAAV